MQLDLDGVLWCVPAEALAPVVADSVRKNVSIPRESGRCDAAANLRVALETVLGVFVPEVEGAIATGCGEGAMLGVEGDGVDGVDLGDVALGGVLLSVALEGEVQAAKHVSKSWAIASNVNIPGVLILDVLNRAASLDTADCEARSVGEATDNTCLPLERADDGLVNLGGFVQVDHVDVSLSGCDNEQLVLDVHAVNAVLAVQCANGLRTLQIPELDLLVPGACRDVVLSAGLEPAHALDGFIVCFGLLCLHLTAGSDVTEIDNVEVTSRVACRYSCAVLFTI